MSEWWRTGGQREVARRYMYLADGTALPATRVAGPARPGALLPLHSMEVKANADFGSIDNNTLAELKGSSIS